jgi:hypothetical protein
MSRNMPMEGVPRLEKIRHMHPAEVSDVGISAKFSSELGREEAGMDDADAQSLAVGSFAWQCDRLANPQ